MPSYSIGAGEDAVLEFEGKGGDTDCAGWSTRIFGQRLDGFGG